MEPPASRAPGPADALIVELVLNGVRKGELTVLATPDGDYFAGADDLADLGVQLRSMPHLIDGRRYHSLRELGAIGLRLDEIRIELHADLPPELLPAHALDFHGEQRPRVQMTRDNSAFLNYRTSHSASSTEDSGQWTLATELGVRMGDWLLRTESLHARGAGERQDLRLATSLTHDDRSSLRRWTVGDFSTAADELGSVLSVGGIGLSNSVQIDPYFIRQPMAAFQGSVSSPSTAEIYLDGVRIRTETLPPGPFELRNLQAYGGRRDLTVVLRDSLGREQRLVAPYYFTPTLLREGLHEYDYGFGLKKQTLGSQGTDYRGMTVAALHRYGLSNAMTLGGHAQAESGRYHLGPTMAVRSNRWGLFTGSLSTGKDAGLDMWAGVVRHSFQSRTLNTQLQWRRHSTHYRPVGSGSATRLPESEFSGVVSLPARWLGSISLGYHNQRSHDGEERQGITLGLSHGLSRSTSLSVSVDRSWGDSADTRVLATLIHRMSRDFTSQLTHYRLGDNSGEVLQLGNRTPIGEGLGYRFVGERTQGADGSAWQWNPSLQYNHRWGRIDAELQATQGPDGRHRHVRQVGIAGGIAYIGGATALSRPVADSFASVEVGGVEGVRVYRNSELIGRTDAGGRIFVPDLSSYLHNRIAIDDRDIPIEHLIARKELLVSPPLRGGSLVRFDVARNQTVTGRLMLRRKGGPVAAAYGDLQVKIGVRTLSFPTGGAGEFYIDGLQPGRHTVRLRQRELSCEFDLTVPESLEMLLDVGELHACNEND